MPKRPLPRPPRPAAATLATVLAAILLSALVATPGASGQSGRPPKPYLGERPSNEAVAAENERLGDHLAEIDRLIDAAHRPPGEAADDAGATDEADGAEAALADANAELKAENRRLGDQIAELRRELGGADAADGADAVDAAEPEGAAEPLDATAVAALRAENRRLRTEVGRRLAALAEAEGRPAVKLGAVPDVQVAGLVGDCATGALPLEEVERRVRSPGELVGEVADGPALERAAARADNPVAQAALDRVVPAARGGATFRVYRWKLRVLDESQKRQSYTMHAYTVDGDGRVAFAIYVGDRT